MSAPLSADVADERAREAALGPAARRDAGRTRRSERAFVSAAAAALLLTAAVTVPLSYVLAGTPGVLGAAVALAFLVLLFGLSSLLHALAAPHGRDVWLIITVGGLVLRLVLYVVLLLTLRDLQGIDGTALGLSAAAGIVVGHVFEMRALVRARRHDVVRAAAAGTTRRPGAGERSEEGVEE